MSSRHLLALIFSLWGLISFSPARELSLRSQFASVRATGSIEELSELLARVPLNQPLWAEITLEVLSRQSFLMDSWLFEMQGDNVILSDDPLEPLLVDLFPEQSFQPDFSTRDTPESRYAKLYFQQGKYSESLLFLQKIERQEPKDLILLQNMAAIYEKAGYPEHALNRLNLILDLSPDPDLRLQIRLRKARLLSRLERDRDCLEVLEKLRATLETRIQKATNRLAGSEGVQFTRFFRASLDEKTLLAAVKNAIGAIHYRLGGDVLAFEAFDSLGKKWPGVLAYAMNRSKVWLNRRYYDSTLKSVNDMLGNVLKVEAGLRKRAESRIVSGNLDSGRALAEAANHFAAIHAILIARKAEVLYQAELYPQALEIFQKATELSPQVPHAWFRQGQILAEEQEKFSESIAAFRRALKDSEPSRAIHGRSLQYIEQVFREESRTVVANASDSLRLKDEVIQNLSVKQQEDLLEAARFMAIGRRWFRQGRFRRIVDEFQKAVTQWGNILEVPLLLARAYRELGQADLSQFYYEQVLKQTPDHLEALAGKAVWLALKQRKSEAMKLLLRLKELAPDAAATRAAMGQFWYVNQENGRAIRAFEEAIAMEPGNGEWHYRLAMVWMRMGSYEMAARKFEDARVSGYPYTRVHLLKGLALLKTGRAREGEKSLLKASSQKADSVEIQGFARRLLSDLSEARRLNSTSPGDWPESIRPLFGFQRRENSLRDMQSAMDLLAKGSTLKALQRLKKALSKDPSNLALIHKTALTELLLDREEEAWQRLLRAQGDNPWDWRLLGSIAEIAFRRGMLDQSLLAWQRMPSDSGLLDESDYVEGALKNLNRRLQLQPSDEWAIYHKALILLHVRRDSDALEVLSRHQVREDRRTEYGSSILILRAQILYRLALSRQDSEMKAEALQLLKRADYRYLDVARRYDSVRDVLPDPPRKIPGIERVSSEDLAFLKKKETRQGARTHLRQTVPWLRKADNLAIWKKVDGILDSEDHVPRKVLTSYDQYKRKKRQEEYEPVPGWERSRQEEKERKEDAAVVTEEYQKRLSQAIEHIQNGRFSEAMAGLQDALSYRPDGEEAYFGILALLLLDGRYDELDRLASILDGLGSHQVMVLALKAHMEFQRGRLEQARIYLKRLPDQPRLPANRIVRELLEVYTNTARRASTDFEANFRLGLLLSLTLQYDKARMAYERISGPRGLEIYKAEVSAFHAHQSRRLKPALEALETMRQLNENDPRDVHSRLAVALDRFVREYRFVTQ